MSVSTSFGAWLKQRRKSLDLTQEDLARQVGCTASLLQKIESGERRPSRQMVDLLAEALGIAPDKRSALMEFARADPSLSVRRSHLSRSNLPAPITPLIGRDEDVANVCRRLRHEDTRLLTLIGPPGIGKTRLSLQVASEMRDQFDDGVFFVSLGLITDPDLIVPTIAQTLGVTEMVQQTPHKRLVDYLRDRSMLLVLDNFEQVVDAAPLVADLLVACALLKIIVTSRFALRIRAERQYPVPTLAVPDLQRLPSLEVLTHYNAVKLFIERAVAVMPSFEVNNANAPAVAQLCYHLDGIPLALELAAARVRGLKVEQIAQRLGDRFRLLTDGGRTILPQHQTLRAMIDWSYGLLTDRERSLFRRLAVFAGGWSIEAAEVVCAADGLESPEILDLLLHLVDKSLISMDEHSAETRYHMLETIREYAWERLRESGEADDIQHQHLGFFLGLAEEAELKLRGVEQAVWLNRLEVDHDNMRAALKWSQAALGQADAGLRLGGALVHFWMVHGYFKEGQRWLEQALRTGGGAPPIVRAKALSGAGTMAWCQSNYQRAIAFHAESLALYQALGDKRGIAESLTNLGVQALYQSNHEQAMSLLQEGLQCYRELGEKSATANTLINLGEVERHLGDLEGATARYEESLVLFRELGDTRWIAVSIHNLGLVAADRGDFVRAMRLQRESLVLFQELGDKQALPECLEKLADVFEAQQYPERAARLLGAAEALREATSVPVPPVDRTDYERTVAAVHTQLGEVNFASAWAAGRAMTPEQAIEYALAAET